MFKNYKYSFVLILILTCSQSSDTYSGNIIFDLGGVLIDVNSSAYWKIGPLTFLRYIGTFNNPFSLRSRFITFLDFLIPHTLEKSIPIDENGNKLPQIMCNWLMGHNPYLLLETIHHAIDNDQKYFNSLAEKRIMHSITDIIFDPQAFVQTQKLVCEGIEFVKECKNNGHKVFILSNWDAVSFSILYEQKSSFFNLFDGIVISGNVGLVKPDPTIFKYLLHTYDLDPQECIFIDDQIENIKTAESLGITSIQCIHAWTILLHKKPDFTTLRKQIIELQQPKILLSTEKIIT